MRYGHEATRRPRGAKVLAYLSVIGGLILLPPSAVNSQQTPTPPAPAAPTPAPAPAATDSAICAQLVPYMMENMDLLMDSASTVDTIPPAAQKAIAAAVSKGQFDTASAVLRRALPDSGNAKTVKGINVFFKMLAGVPDSARAKAATQFTQEVAAIPRGSFRLFAEMPDSLQRLFIAMFSSGKNEFSCSP